MAATDQNSNAVLSGLARHINCLGEDNKMARRKALENIRKESSGRKPPLETSELKPVLNELLKPLLKEFSDPVEKCREIALDILKSFHSQVSSPEDYLPYVMPVIVQRLGQQDIVEQSEELRLQMVEFLLQILERSGKKIALYLDDLIKILQRTLIDPFADVKKKSCQCSSILAKAIPEYFVQQSESLIKPLCMSISHQHSKVRSTVVYTIGDVIQFGNGKSVETVVSHLAQRLFDQAPAVRMAVTKVVGGWLLDLMDRYSFWNKLIPLLLTSLSDEQPEIREVADSLWHDIGLKYASENEDDLKDKQDFPLADPSHYPKGVERPNLGCRTLMFRNMSRILPALMRDITDWVVSTRQTSARLLYHVLLNGEEYMTQHLELLTSGMYRACADEETSVVKNVQKAAELIGYFVPVDVWSKLILKGIESQQSYTNIMVLSAVVRGTERTKLTPYLRPILDTVSNPEVCQSVQTGVQLQLLCLLESLMSVCQSDMVSDQAIKQAMFDLLHTVMALNQGEAILHKVYELLTSLAKLDGLDDRKQLYKTLTRPLLVSFTDTYEIWATHSVERLIFDAVIMEAGPVVGEILDLIVPMLAANLRPDRDVAVRLKFFTLLSHLSMNCKDTVDSENKFSDFAEVVVRDMIIPNCVWKAGRTESGIRTMAVSCAWTLLQSGILTKEKLESVLDKFVTQMLTCMDDDNKNTRLVACRVMTRTFELAGSLIDQDRLHNMYPELIKRLDDSNDDIRVTVTRTFLAYFDSFTDGYNATLYRAHLEALYKGLMVHLDDPDEKIQEAVLGVLKKAGALFPGMLIQEVETSKHKHRSKKYCEELTEYLHKLSVSQTS